MSVHHSSSTTTSSAGTIRSGNTSNGSSNSTNMHQQNQQRSISTSSTSNSGGGGGSTIMSNNTATATATGGTQACAACKFQRRKCSPECPLAPYFPPDQPKQFLNVHKLYGVSNTLRILKQVHPSKRNDAMKSILYEADARDRDPVHGCLGIITFLHTQAQLLREELDFVRTQIHILDHQQQQQQQSLQQTPLCGSSSYGMLNHPAAASATHHFLLSCPSTPQMHTIASGLGTCNSPVSSPDSYHHPYHHHHHGLLQYASPPSADSYGGGGGGPHHVHHGHNTNSSNSADSYVVAQPLCLQSNSPPFNQMSNWQTQQQLLSSPVNWLAYQYMQQQQQQQQANSGGMANCSGLVDATSALLVGMAGRSADDLGTVNMSMKASNIDVRPSFDTRSLADYEPLAQHSYHDSAPKTEAAYESSAESSIKDQPHSLEHDELQSAAALFALTSGTQEE